MPYVHFADTLIKPKDLFNDETSLAKFLKANQLSENTYIAPGKAFSFDVDDINTAAVIRTLNSLPSRDRQVIAESAAISGDEFDTVARFTIENLNPEVLETINSLVGAGATAAHTRLSDFQTAILNHQNALHDHNKAARANSISGMRAYQTEVQVKATRQTLERRFPLELNRVSDPSLRHKNRGNALSNLNRALTLAERNPNSPKIHSGLYISDTSDVRRYGGYARIMQNLGRGTVLVGAGAAILEVQNTAQAGGDWLRESTRQMVGFGLSGYWGAISGKHATRLATFAGTRAIGALATKGTIVAAGKVGLVAAGPIGWAILGTAILIGVSVGYQVGKLGGSVGRNSADRGWNWSAGR